MKKNYTLILYFLLIHSLSYSQENLSRISVFKSLQDKAKIESDFIQIREGDMVSLNLLIQGTIKNKTIPTVLKGLGVGLLTYQSSKLLYDSKISGYTKDNALAPIGIGLIASSNSIFKRKTRITVHFDFYDSEKRFLYSTEKEIHRITPEQDIRESAIQNGYVVVSIKNGKKGSLRNGYVDISVLPSNQGDITITNGNDIFNPADIVITERPQIKSFSVTDIIIPDVTVIPINPISLNYNKKVKEDFKEETSFVVPEIRIAKVKNRGRKLTPEKNTQKTLPEIHEAILTPISITKSPSKKAGKNLGQIISLKPRRRIKFFHDDDNEGEFDKGFSKYDDPIYMSTDNIDSYDGSSGVVVWGVRYIDPFPDYSYDPPSNDLPSYFFDETIDEPPTYYEETEQMQTPDVPCNDGDISFYTPKDLTKAVLIGKANPSTRTAKVTFLGHWVGYDIAMPKIITSKGGADTTDPSYQRFDYMIAAYTAYFNYLLAKGDLDLWWDNGSPDGYQLSKASISTIPQLDPTLVKAIIMQETTMGKDSNKHGFYDIMQANVYGDWSNNKKHFELTRGEVPTTASSIWAGIRYLAVKGFREDGGGRSNTFLGWDKAVENYNGGGVHDYKDRVLGMYNNSREPASADYNFANC